MSRLPLSRLVVVLAALATLAIVSLAYSRNARLGDPFGVNSLLGLPIARAAQSQELTP